MSKITVVLIIILIAIIILLYFPFKLKTKEIIVGNQKLTVEVATTPRQLTQGLSNRQELCQNCGMLFVFPYPQILSFWMKDTLIPLDMIFIDKDNKITNIVTALPAKALATAGQVDLPIYTSSSPALYCLELNANRATELNLKPGDIIKL